jgi:hypothetical protein
MQLNLSRQQLITGLLLAATYILFIYSAISLLGPEHFQHFTLQAESLLQGKLEITDLSRVNNIPDPSLDFNYSNGKYYWTLGIFPAVVMMPFVAVGSLFSTAIVKQGIVQIVINMAVYFLAFKIARKVGFKLNDSLLLALSFCFGSIYMIVMLKSFSWYFNQSITVVLMMFSIWLYLSREKYSKLLVGFLYAAILTTRITAAIPGAFFALHVLQDKKLSRREKAMELLKLGAPVVAGLIILGWLNHIRFGNAFDNGYWTALINPQIQITMREQYGLFKLDNIISNFYIYFLMPYDPVFAPGTYHLVAPFLRPSPIGLSFFLASPIFMWLIAKWRDIKKVPQIQNILIATVPVVFILLTYYASGFTTLGPRYLLDVFPFLYLILLYVLPKRGLSKFQCAVIVVSICVNIYSVISLYSFVSTLYWKS